MKNLLSAFDDAAQRRVNDAIQAAESQTMAEILPVVARSSGRYERASDLLGLWCGWLLVGVAWWIFQAIVPSDSWEGSLIIRLGFWWILGLFLIGFIGGVVAGERVPGLRQIFVAKRDAEAQLIERAKSVFFEMRVHRTSRGTGILIFASLLERRVVVLADDSIADQLSERALSEVRDEIVEGIKKSGLADGFVAGIERVGQLLATVLPADDNRVDEVPSEVVILD